MYIYLAVNCKISQVRVYTTLEGPGVQGEGCTTLTMKTLFRHDGSETVPLTK